MPECKKWHFRASRFQKLGEHDPRPPKGRGLTAPEVLQPPTLRGSAAYFGTYVYRYLRKNIGYFEVLRYWIEKRWKTVSSLFTYVINRKQKTIFRFKTNVRLEMS